LGVFDSDFVIRESKLVTSDILINALKRWAKVEKVVWGGIFFWIFFFSYGKAGFGGEFWDELTGGRTDERQKDKWTSGQLFLKLLLLLKMEP